MLLLVIFLHVILIPHLMSFWQADAAEKSKSLGKSERDVPGASDSLDDNSDESAMPVIGKSVLAVSEMQVSLS